jgi:hypothetical protein
MDDKGGVMNDRTGFQSRLLVGLLVAALSAISCAGSDKLAKQSEQAYGEGNLEKAYQKAARALRKEPGNPRARAAMTMAAGRLMDERETEIRGIAARDTVAAAKRSLALDAFRDELLGYRVILPPDPDFDRDEAAIRTGAARLVYEESVDALESGAPKRAYDGFQLAKQFQPRFRDVARRIDQAYDEALPRVAFLPFANETDLPELSKEFSDRAYSEIARRIANNGFRFTELTPRERVYQSVPMAAMDHLGARKAARIGRDLGVDRVIVGRFFGLRTKTNLGAFPQAVFYKTVEKDEQGASHDRWSERAMIVLTRDRDLTVGYEYSIVDVHDGSAIAGNTGTIHAAAHAILASAAIGGGDPGDYALTSPDLEQRDPDRAKRMRSDWQDRCGDWKVSEVIARSRREEKGYESRYQNDWVLRSDRVAIFLGGLPSESELVKYAYGQVWEPLTETLHSIDQAEPSAFSGASR